MRRGKLPPDTRPKSTDEVVPCIRRYKMPDGSERTDVDPDYETRYRQHLMESANYPSWRYDPTYNLRRIKDARLDQTMVRTGRDRKKPRSGPG